MTKAEREREKKEAGRSTVRLLRSDATNNAHNALGPWGTERGVFYRERARLYRIALRAVREEVRRGK